MGDRREKEIKHQIYLLNEQVNVCKETIKRLHKKLINSVGEVPYVELIKIKEEITFLNIEINRLTNIRKNLSFEQQALYAEYRVNRQKEKIRYKNRKRK